MKILIVTKRSKLEFERDKFGLSEQDIIKKYNKERANLDAILDSHYKQLEVRKNIKNIMYNCDMCNMNKVAEYLNNESLQSNKYDLVLTIGGDNLYTFIAHYVAHLPILGINSDPERSVGCLNRWAISDKKDIYALATMIDNKAYDIVQWPRISATIDKVPVTQAVSEYYFGERLRKNMSRHVLVYEGKEYEQKSSGILFATGAGSTGWFKSSGGFPWKPEERQIQFRVTEPYNLNLVVISGMLKKNKPIKIYSLNDDEGYCSVDSWEEFEFTRGSGAEITWGNDLNVIIPRRK